ncbi:MAG TPA: IS982 family transposase [Anaerolineae bacterium]|nr:IS982 family transposase [Anaerolineae bacterium]
MLGLTDYITRCRWGDVFLTWYVLVDDALRAVKHTVKVRHSGPPPVFSDSEVITISLIADTYFHGHEELTLSFIRQHYRDYFPQLLSNSRFNRRRRSLTLVMEAIRQQLSQAGLADEDLRLIDSVPITVCASARGHQCASLQGGDYYGVLPNQHGKLFGLRLALTVTLGQVIDQWLLVPARPHDSQMAEALLENICDQWLVGDNGYYSPSVAARLQQRQHITLLAPPRRSQQHRQWPHSLRRLTTRIRRRIESAVSVLAEVFQVEHPKARSLTGVVARVTTRILAYTISFPAMALLNPNSN